MSDSPLWIRIKVIPSNFWIHPKYTPKPAGHISPGEYLVEQRLEKSYARPVEYIVAAKNIVGVSQYYYTTQVNIDEDGHEYPVVDTRADMCHMYVYEGDQRGYVAYDVIMPYEKMVAFLKETLNLNIVDPTV